LNTQTGITTQSAFTYKKKKVSFEEAQKECAAKPATLTTAIANSGAWTCGLLP